MKRTKKAEAQWKLTAITMSKGNKKYQGFHLCKIIDGKTVLPRSIMNKIEAYLGVKLGDTITIG